MGITFLRKSLDPQPVVCYIYPMLSKQEIASLNFTRRHFEFLACTLGEISDRESREEVLTDTCIRLKGSHPRFDETRFRERVNEVHLQCWEDDWREENFLAGSNL